MTLVRTYKKAKLSLGENSKPTQYKRIGENFVANRASMHYEIDNDFKYLFPSPIGSATPFVSQSLNKIILPNPSLFSVGDTIFLKIKFNTNLPQLNEDRLRVIAEQTMFFNHIDSQAWALKLNVTYSKKGTSAITYDISDVNNGFVQKTNDSSAINGFSQQYRMVDVPDEDFFVVQFVNLGAMYGEWDFVQVLSSSLCKQVSIAQLSAYNQDQNNSGNEEVTFEFLQNGKINYTINALARAFRFSGAGAVGQDNLNI